MKQPIIELSRKRLLSGIPTIIGVLSSYISDEDLKKKIRQGISVFEFRYDLFAPGYDEALKWLVHSIRNFNLPVLGTLREHGISSEKRILLFEKLMDICDAVDIEWDCPQCDVLCRKAAEKSCEIIISHHDFSGIPPLRIYKDIFIKAKECNASAVKLAVTSAHVSETASFLSFVQQKTQSDNRVIGIVMGPHGLISRHIAPLFGSLCSYGSITGAVVPGQPDTEELHALFKKYFPAYSDRSKGKT